jgi:aryl-alcohol dehydrogenase-like predicted oxidoreductase
MRFVEVGGLRVSAIGLGTWQFGSREWGYGEEYADREAGDITRRALDLGINLIDTAEIYAFGRSERTVGRAIQGRRDEAFVATKLLPVVPVASVVRRRALASARRLLVDHIDLYQIHWPNPVFPLTSTMRGMAALVRNGTVAHVGVSNFSLERWRSAEDAMGGQVISNQVEYSLVQRRAERELLPWAADTDHLIIAYSPLAQGFLSGRYDSDHRPSGMRAGRTLFQPENLRRGAELIGTLRDVAESHGATPAQVALAWVIRRPNVVVIPGASGVGQLEENAAVADLELSDDDDASLTEASDRFAPTKGAFLSRSTSGHRRRRR